MKKILQREIEYHQRVLYYLALEYCLEEALLVYLLEDHQYDVQQ